MGHLAWFSFECFHYTGRRSSNTLPFHGFGNWTSKQSGIASQSMGKYQSQPWSFGRSWNDFFRCMTKHGFLWMTKHLTWKNCLGEAERIHHWLKNHWQSYVVFVDQESRIIAAGMPQKPLQAVGVRPPKKTAAARSAKESPKRSAICWVCLKNLGEFGSHKDTEKLREVRRNGTFLDFRYFTLHWKELHDFFSTFFPRRGEIPKLNYPMLRGHVSQKNHEMSFNAHGVFNTGNSELKRAEPLPGTCLWGSETRHHQQPQSLCGGHTRPKTRRNWEKILKLAC